MAKSYSPLGEGGKYQLPAVPKNDSCHAAAQRLGPLARRRSAEHRVERLLALDRESMPGPAERGLDRLHHVVGLGRAGLREQRELQPLRPPRSPAPHCAGARPGPYAAQHAVALGPAVRGQQPPRPASGRTGTGSRHAASRTRPGPGHGPSVGGGAVPDDPGEGASGRSGAGRPGGRRAGGASGPWWGGRSCRTM